MTRSAKPQIITEFGEPPQPVSTPSSAVAPVAITTPADASPVVGATAISGAADDAGKAPAGTGGKRRPTPTP